MNRTSFSLTLLLATAFVVVPGAVAQEESTTEVRIDFQSTDINNDGYITRDELPADHPLLIRFESLDRNGDERLGDSELKDFQ